MNKLSVHQRKARDFIMREDWGNALAELERVLTSEADNPTLHNQIGDVYLRKEDVASACEHFERAIDLYAGEGLHNNAVALCKKIMRLRPGRFQIRYRLARLRLDQGFRTEAALFFAEYLEHAPTENEHTDALEAHCHEIIDLLPDNAPVGKILEKLEVANRFVAAFEIVRKLARRAADAGDEAAAGRYTEKMRSLRILVERSGGRDLLAALPGAPSGEIPAAGRPELEIVLDVDGHGEPGGALAPGVQSLFIDELLAGGAESGESTGGGAIGGAVADEIAAPTADAMQPAVAAPALDLEPLDAPAAGASASVRFPAPSLLADEGSSPAPALATMWNEPRPVELDAAPDEPAPTEYELPETSFAELAQDLGEAIVAPGFAAAPEPASMSTQQADPKAATVPAPPPVPDAPQSAPAATSSSGWVEELRRAPVWIPPTDAPEPPDPELQEGGASMELESVIDSFREQMARALDGDGAARYDLGVAYYEMGLYNESLAEFEAAARSPGLEIQSLEMLAACLLQTGRHAEVVELLVPLLAADGHSPRGRLGLQYSLGLAYEALGDENLARRCFEEVALVDIDFKDVQARLQRT